MEIICVPAIVSLVFCLIETYKKATEKSSKKEIFLRIIPIVSAGLGIIAGIVCFYAFPTIIAAQEIFTAMLIGGASGLSATGCNQIFKQLKKFGIEIKEDENDEGKNDEPKD